MLKDDLIKLNQQYVTTSAVILEFGNAFSPVSLKSTAIQIIDSMTQSTKWKIINIDDQLMKKGLKLYKKMKDKEWGLVDCTSILISRELGVGEIFTTDHHFEQAGFTILLKK